jgi:hypothetical protein
MTKPEKTTLYMEFLTQEGYRPTAEPEGDVLFKAEGHTYVLPIDDKDENFFQLVFYNFWAIESEEELWRAVSAANFATRETKVAKVFVRNDGRNVIATVEMFLFSPDNFPQLFGRALGALKYAVEKFAGEMRRSAASSEAAASGGPSTD